MFNGFSSEDKHKWKHGPSVGKTEDVPAYTPYTCVQCGVEFNNYYHLRGPLDDIKMSGIDMTVCIRNEMKPVMAYLGKHKHGEAAFTDCEHCNENGLCLGRAATIGPTKKKPPEIWRHCGTCGGGPVESSADKDRRALLQAAATIFGGLGREEALSKKLSMSETEKWAVARARSLWSKLNED